MFRISLNTREDLYHYLKCFKSCGEFISGDGFLADSVYVSQDSKYASVLEVAFTISVS